MPSLQLQGWGHDPHPPPPTPGCLALHTDLDSCLTLDPDGQGEAREICVQGKGMPTGPTPPAFLHGAGKLAEVLLSHVTWSLGEPQLAHLQNGDDDANLPGVTWGQ